MKIKKRTGWTTSWPPGEPYKPLKPRSHWEQRDFVAVCDSSGENEMKLMDVLSRRPEDMPIENLVIQSDGDERYTCIRVGYYVVKQVPVPGYAMQLKKYEKDLLQYEAAHANWLEEVKAWEEWKQQQEEADLKKQLDRAEALLKQHGRLK